MATPEPVVVIGSGQHNRATMMAAISSMDSTCEIIVIGDIRDYESVSRGYGKTEAIARMVITNAIREDMYEIELREKQAVKQTWNRNRQRNLRHYPGRRWIDTRTTNK